MDSGEVIDTFWAPWYSIPRQSSIKTGGIFLFAKTKSATVLGVQGHPVTIELDVSGGLPGLEIVGMPDTSVKESRHRVRSAIHNQGWEVPSRRITVNLAPGNLHKEGTQMDLGMAVALLVASGQLRLNRNLDDYIFLGELALDGGVRHVPGVLAMVLDARGDAKGAVIPACNLDEVSFVTDMDLVGVSSLKEAGSFLEGNPKIVSSVISERKGLHSSLSSDMQDIKGHKAAKRALEIAAAGAHNVLMVGPPGSGKSLLASSLPGILPSLSYEESLEVTKIWSVAGILPQGAGLLEQRPFRAPHHTITCPALIGGGGYPKPGEVTLSHRGILFLDELPQFSAQALNALRQPLEEGVVRVTRYKGTFTFPARCQVIAGMNPCPCGFYGSDYRQCECTEHQRRQYTMRIEGPLLDRIDIFLNVQRIDGSELDRYFPGEPSSSVRERVEMARGLQKARLKGTGLSCNAEMGPKLLSTLITVSRQARRLLLQAYSNLGLSARGYYRVLKVAATIADLSSSPRVEEEHVAEALSYRQRVI